MLEPTAHSDKVLLEKAKADIAKFELHSWVCRQNVERGLAPTVGALIQQWDGKGAKVEGVVSYEPSRSRSRWASYKWISRWRKKWRMPKAKIQDRDSPTPSEMREKVWPRQCPSWQSCISRFAPICGVRQSRASAGAVCKKGVRGRSENGTPGHQIFAERGAGKRTLSRGRLD